MKYREALSCRSCLGGRLRSVLDLGALHVNAFPLPGEPDTEKAPLELMLCDECTLVQLRHSVNPDLLYRTFHYRSGITATMRRALGDIITSCQKRISLSGGDTVIDIGSNDSTLLKLWPEYLDRIGFEPATNLMAEARSPGLTIVNDYFSFQGFREVSGKKAAVVTAIAMFYDLDEPNAFVSEVARALRDDGIFVIQMAYLPKMLETNDVGNICHEHLEYYSLRSLHHLLVRHGLHLFDAELNDINGGSFRIYASKERRPLSPTLVHLLGYEQTLRLDSKEMFADFRFRVEQLRDVVRLLMVSMPQPLYIYGASTKGNTLLQYWDLRHECFMSGSPAGAAERDPLKIGRETVGTRIPIVPEDFARRNARTFLVLPWHFETEIVAREAEWLRGGGKLLFPMPLPRVVEAHDIP